MTEFNPKVGKTDAVKNMRNLAIRAKGSAKKSISRSALNKCFGLTGNTSKMVLRAMDAMPNHGKGLLDSHMRFALDDARKVIDFVYGNRSKAKAKASKK